MSELKTLLTEIFTSKKALAAMSGLCVIAAKRLGLDIDDATMYSALAMIGSFIIGQGLTDIGKPAAEITSGKSSPVVVSVFADNRIEEILRANPRLIPHAERFLIATQQEIDETVDEILSQCTVAVADTVVPKP
jgi:hypothetical protein